MDNLESSKSSRPVKPFDLLLLCFSVVILVSSCAASVAHHKPAPSSATLKQPHVVQK
jgi:hypothetical protein